jgi:hypothetical protein
MLLERNVLSISSEATAVAGMFSSLYSMLSTKEAIMGVR